MAYLQDRAFTYESVKDLTIVDDGGGQNLAPADDGGVYVKDGDWTAGRCQLQIGLIKISQTCELLHSQLSLS